MSEEPSAASGGPQPASETVPTAASAPVPQKKPSGLRWIVLLVAILLMAGVGTVIAIGPETLLNKYSPVLVRVTGRVNFNGKPMSAGMVQTYYERRGLLGGLAEIRSDGTFELLTNGDPGIFAGEHRVVVLWMEGGFPPRPLVPQKYTDPQNTPFIIHVPRSGTKEVLLELEGQP